MTAASTEAKIPRARRSKSEMILRELRKAPLTAWFGMIVVAAYVFVALFAPWIAPYGESEVVSDEPFALWSSEFLFGTDQLGRDLFSRMIYAARNSMGIAFAATAVAFLTGGLIGIVSALLRGWFDQLASRLVDAVMAIPSLIFALMVLAIFEQPTILNIILVIGLVDATRVFRLTRAVAMNVVALDFVEAARLRGEKTPWIVLREIVPNIMPPLVTEFGLRYCFVFLTISSLSFLGLGMQPPTADWGLMVKETATLITYGDITPLLPAGAIALLTVAINFIVDWFLHKTSGLRDGQ
ncbi:peptide/nickel transport system permease protein [Dongia mobilis]|uniref:Peptide/nickel transport system permease protein n=1 Tax=Dongia mobilis TaxID=578943 RepID=A0A4R6WK70_9PROT|nr:ABC transporter permease [Dongia mobilis]TDQ80797.1 peptide/nickel transport system permease protein [Dongia mobilis]